MRVFGEQSSTLRVVAAFALAAVLVVPAALLIWVAAPRFSAGLAVRDTNAVLSDRLLGLAIAPAESQAAEAALEHAVPTDGESEMWRAELLAVREAKDARALARAKSLVLDGLTKYPASPRGWTLLCEIDIKISRSQAAACMDTAFYIGPFDWFVARRRTILSAYLFPQLDRDTQDAAARRFRLIAEDPGLRYSAYEAAHAPNGAGLVTAAFAGEPAALNAFVRGLAQAPIVAGGSQ